MLPLQPLTCDSLSDAANIRHGFFTRAGGVSSGLYASLNCGVGSADDPTHVIENRTRIARHFNAKLDALATLHQVHSARAVIIDASSNLAERPQADALVTKTPGLVLGVLSADCAPVLFADPDAKVVAAAHAGWKGALTGVCEAAVAGMETLGAQRSRIRAVVGPTILQPAYEVGPEFEARFLEARRSNHTFFNRATPASRPHFDLPGFIAARLSALELDTVEVLEACTASDSQRFFSFRRATLLAECDYGRQLSAIVVT